MRKKSIKNSEKFENTELIAEDLSKEYSLFRTIFDRLSEKDEILVVDYNGGHDSGGIESVSCGLYTKPITEESDYNSIMRDFESTNHLSKNFEHFGLSEKESEEIMDILYNMIGESFNDEPEIIGILLFDYRSQIVHNFKQYKVTMWEDQMPVRFKLGSDEPVIDPNEILEE